MTGDRSTSAIIKFVAPADLAFQPVDRKESLFPNREPKPFRLSPICESEQRLWKLSAQAESSKFAMIELFLLVMFLIVAFVAITSCFAELSHLLLSDAIGHVAMKAVNGGV